MHGGLQEKHSVRAARARGGGVPKKTLKCVTSAQTRTVQAMHQLLSVRVVTSIRRHFIRAQVKRRGSRKDAHAGSCVTVTRTQPGNLAQRGDACRIRVLRSEVCPWQPSPASKWQMTKARRVWLIKRSPPPLRAPPPHPYTNSTTGQSRVPPRSAQFN